MSILEKIIAHKKEEIEVRKMLVSEQDLKSSEYFERKCLSLKNNLLEENATGIIAEFKRKSPSKGFINKDADVELITKAYHSFGASGISVLTDHEFFGGSTHDLLGARQNEIPILRKDFIIDPYQVMAAKAMGADVILLIAACLAPAKVKSLATFAKECGLEVLLELHEENEIDHICDEVDMIGINNRSLKTFEVDIDRSLQMGRNLPTNRVLVAESGINSIDTIKVFRDAGFKGFLMGENFMKEEDPGLAFKLFVSELQRA
jgi:indole-3-glycerol phosphate synthase